MIDDNDEVYYCCYVDDEGAERVSRFPYLRRPVAEKQAAWLKEMGYVGAHVRVAHSPTGEIIQEEIPAAARKVH